MLTLNAGYTISLGAMEEEAALSEGAFDGACMFYRETAPSGGV